PSVNQRLPSGPVVMPKGKLLAVGIGNSVTVPLGVIRPMLFPSFSVNQTLPSGPDVMPDDSLLAVGRGNSVMVPVGGNPADIAHRFRKPKIPVRTCCDVQRSVVACCWKFGDGHCALSMHVN